MTVKERVGRPRYVAFRIVEGAPARRDALTAALPDWAKLTRFDGTHGIVRCLHKRRTDLVDHLNALALVGTRDVRIATLATSGTIRKAALALPPEAPARESGPKPPRNPGPKQPRLASRHPD